MEGIIGLVVLIGVILLLRLIGAWLFRINEIINNQKEIISELKKLSGKTNSID